MREWKEDLLGKTFGFLIVKEKILGRKGSYRWLCECICGKKIIKYGRELSSALNNSKTRISCGCNNDQEMIGKKYGSCLILSISSEKTPTGRKLFICRCDCGETTKRVKEHILRRSTGCKACHMTKRKGKPQIKHRKEFGIGIRNQIIANYRCNAKAKKREFLLSIEECEVLFKGNCYYCNVAPNKKAERKGMYGYYIYNGIDRLDSSKGYTKSNCVTCCYECNQFKTNIHVNDFLERITRIYNHRCKN